MGKIAQTFQQTANAIQLVTGSISTLTHQALSASMAASPVASPRFTLDQQLIRLHQAIDAFLSRARAA